MEEGEYMKVAAKVPSGAGVRQVLAEADLDAVVVTTEVVDPKQLVVGVPTGGSGGEPDRGSGGRGRSRGRGRRYRLYQLVS